VSIAPDGCRLRRDFSLTRARENNNETRDDDGKSSARRFIVIQLTKGAPKQFRPNALAYALPYEGAHIVVFYDRVQSAPSNITAVVLAHVLVHEITHILEGVNSHSETGVMKAAWAAHDYQAMAVKPLPFTERDIQLIQHGLAMRTLQATNRVAVNLPD
jgi:hypothetical protein